MQCTLVPLYDCRSKLLSGGYLCGACRCHRNSCMYCGEIGGIGLRKKSHNASSQLTSNFLSTITSYKPSKHQNSRHLSGATTTLTQANLSLPRVHRRERSHLKNRTTPLLLSLSANEVPSEQLIRHPSTLALRSIPRCPPPLLLPLLLGP